MVFLILFGLHIIVHQKRRLSKLRLNLSGWYMIFDVDSAVLYALFKRPHIIYTNNLPTVVRDASSRKSLRLPPLIRVQDDQALSVPRYNLILHRNGTFLNSLLSLE
jgi:hypothetical protein